MLVDNQGRPILYPGVQQGFPATQPDIPAGYPRPPRAVIAIYDNTGVVIASNSAPFCPSNGWYMNYDGGEPPYFTITPPLDAALLDGYGAFFTWQDVDNNDFFALFDVRQPVIATPVLSAFGLLLNNAPEISLQGS